MVTIKPTKIEKGTKIVCPLCKSVIGEFLRDLHSGEIITENHIKIYGVEVKKGDEMRCPRLCVGRPLDIQCDHHHIIQSTMGG